jgi:CHAP domain
MNWSEQPPKGGPMVPVTGFPRALYPPDAAPGHTPSTDGPDVEGLKRTLGRIGAWDWNPAGYDRAYSNGFAHGKSDVYGGIAAIQLWAKIAPATGWVGQSTFNFLRSVRVPEGRTNAGQMAMDANAANLISEAYAQFHPAPAPKQTVREKALDGAIKWLGTTESPAGSNHTGFGVWYGVDYQPWCAIFATYCFEVEAGGSPTFAKGSRYAYVPYIVSDARNGRNGLTATTGPVPGDLVCYDWQGDGTFDHVGLFEQWTAHSQGAFTAVEGNTAVGNDSNGGQVMRRDRNIRSASIVFCRVQEP